MDNQTESDRLKNLQRKEGLDIVRRMLPSSQVEYLETGITGTFGGEMPDFSVRGAFAEFWTRPGLDLRMRSFATIAMLIGLRAQPELVIHIRGGLRNGLTLREIEELIYHSLPYVGFPAARIARAAALEAIRLEEEGR